MAKKNSNRKSISAAKVEKASKARSLTKELMDKAVRHIASEIVAAKPGLDGRTPRGFAEKLLKEARDSFPKLTMNKVNYAVKSQKKELKKGSLSFNNNSNISSLSCDDESVKTTASGSTNTTTTSNTSKSPSAAEAEANKASKKRSNAKTKSTSAAEAEANATDDRSKKNNSRHASRIAKYLCLRWPAKRLY